MSASGAAVREGVLVGYGWGWWQLLARAPAAALVPGERPRALALARLVARDASSVTNLLHSPVDLDAMQRSVILRLDGIATIDEIALALGIPRDAVAATVQSLAAAWLLADG